MAPQSSDGAPGALWLIRGARPLMRVLIATAAVVLIVGPRVHAVECTLDDQQWIDDELPRLKSWSSIYVALDAGRK